MKKRKNKYCVDCGRFMWHVGVNRQRCKDCQKTHMLMWGDEYRKRQRSREAEE